MMDLPTTMTIDGFGPLPVVRPSSIAEVGELVRSATASGQAVYPVGGGTMLDYGLTPTKPGTAVDLRGLDRIIDYPARDMTITVEAGITIAKLAEVLRTEGQHLPVDVPFPDRATLGGAMATNASGPRRFGYGTLRDYVIGITIVNDLGQEVKGGGRVVKNVAGYDLMKLYTGSLGTLGVVAQVTLKVKPLPELARWVNISCEPNEITEVLTVLSATRTRPCAMAVRGRGNGGHVVGCSLAVGFEDNALAVEWQMARLREEFPAKLREQLQELTSNECDNLLAALRNFPLAVENALTFKANVQPARTMDFVERAAASELAFHAHVGNGIIVGHLAESSVDRARTRLDDLGRFAGECAGNAVILRCPSEWKSVVPVWGRSTPDRVLMRAVKDKLDPRRVFNPGRFVDGI